MSIYPFSAVYVKFSIATMGTSCLMYLKVLLPKKPQNDLTLSGFRVIDNTIIFGY